MTAVPAAPRPERSHRVGAAGNALSRGRRARCRGRVRTPAGAVPADPRRPDRSGSARAWTSSSGGKGGDNGFCGIRCVGSSPAVRGRWRAKGAGGGAGGSSFDSNENRFQSLVLQDVGGANPQDRDVSLRKPCLTKLIVVLLSGGVVDEPVHLYTRGAAPSGSLRSPPPPLRKGGAL